MFKSINSLLKLNLQDYILCLAGILYNTHQQSSPLHGSVLSLDTHLQFLLTSFKFIKDINK